MDRAGTPALRITDDIYSPLHTPVNHRTRGQWLRDGFRVVGDHTARLLILHNHPHNRRRCPEESLPPDEVEALRSRLEADEYPSDEDRRLIARLDHSAQVSWSHLYPEGSVAPIEEPTQSQAWELLSHLWRRGTHAEQFIFGGTRDTGEKYVYTAGGKISRDWDILDHKKGFEYLGVKRGEYTRIIDIDLDRHTSAVSSRDHLRMVLDTLAFLQRHMPWAAPHVTNINSKNGSCHITLYLPRSVPVAHARLVVEDIRSECPWLEGVEIYPDSCPQFLLPIRRDKVTVIDRVLTPSVKSFRKAELPGQRKKKGRKPQKVRVPYMAMDAAAYWQWINDENRVSCDPALVEAELRKAFRSMPDEGTQGKVSSRPNRKSSGRDRTSDASPPSHPHLSMRGRCARFLLDFLHGNGDGDARVMSAVMLRAFRNAEDMERDEAVALTGDLLGMRPEFRDRPVGERPRLSRMIEATADAVWRDNGYQADPVGSLEIWSRVKLAWNRSGFRLSDPSTWDRAAGSTVTGDERDLVWSPWLLGLVPDLAEAARCDHERAGKLLRLACVHVGDRAEMSLSYLERIMVQVGVAAYRNNAVRVRRYLEDNGVLVLRKRGFRFGEDGGVGNHYTLGLMVEVACPGQGEARGPVVLPAPAKGEEEETSTYPSSGGLDVGSLVERRRLKRCLDHYRERVRAVYGGYRQAA